MATAEGFVRAYRERTPRSQQLWEAARRVLPGGVSGNAKFFKPHPIYVESASGSRVVDVDGNVYIDLLAGAGSAILGHGPPAVTRAVAAQLGQAISPIFATELEIRLARTVGIHMRYMEMVRFVSSGSEATFLLARVARAFTGRERIAKFEGNYHGQHDFGLTGAFVAGAGSDHRPEPIAGCAGTERSSLERLLLLPYNDPAALDIIREHADELAAVFIEPVAGFGIGAIPADRDWLAALRELTAEKGILLVFDEIVTGFRLGLGGASAAFGVQPDLGAIGKIVGGGFPIGGFGGRRDIMEKVVTPTKEPSDVKEKIFASGTFSGNPIGMAAGLAMIAELERGDFYDTLARRGERLRAGLREAGLREGIEVQATGIGSIFHVHFASEPIRDKRSAMRADPVRQYAFSIGMISKGVLLPPAHPGFLSTAHGDADVDEILRVAADVLAEMAAR
ncbi:MAG: aspartate aminotransferase family protein [Deltaproteobacteria bacterium]|nr:aspartate aminotransferase family protein [Deltaproteobacteria bacterium]